METGGNHRVRRWRRRWRRWRERWHRYGGRHRLGLRRHADRGQVGNRIDWGWLRVRIHKRHPPAPWIDRHAILLPERRIRPFPAGAEDVYDDAIGPAQNIHGTFAHLVAGVFEQQPHVRIPAPMDAIRHTERD